MELKNITETADKWNELTSTVLHLKKFEISDMQAILKETYKILKVFHQEHTVPKETCRLLLCVEEFLYFSSMMEEKETPIDFFHYEAISCIVSAMENGFFDGCFAYMFSSTQTGTLYEINMEQNGVADFFQAVKNKMYKNHAGIRLVGHDLP